MQPDSRVSHRSCAPLHVWDVCPRKESGGSIEMNLLEEAALNMAGNTPPVDYNIPPKKGNIAIIGAGPAGMAALLRLSTKKYHVEIFEKTDRTGGCLWDLMDPGIFKSDFEQQLLHQEYELHLNTEIEDLSVLNDISGLRFDAVFVATGKRRKGFRTSGIHRPRRATPTALKRTGQAISPAAC